MKPDITDPWEMAMYRHPSSAIVHQEQLPHLYTEYEDQAELHRAFARESKPEANRGPFFRRKNLDVQEALAQIGSEYAAMRNLDGLVTELGQAWCLPGPVIYDGKQVGAVYVHAAARLGWKSIPVYEVLSVDEEKQMGLSILPTRVSLCKAVEFDADEFLVQLLKNGFPPSFPWKKIDAAQYVAAAAFEHALEDRKSSALLVLVKHFGALVWHPSLSIAEDALIHNVCTQAVGSGSMDLVKALVEIGYEQEVDALISEIDGWLESDNHGPEHDEMKQWSLAVKARKTISSVDELKNSLKPL